MKYQVQVSFDDAALNKDKGRIEYRVSGSVGLAALYGSYSDLLFPPPLSQTNGKRINEPLIGVTALFGRQPVGLMLCELGKDRSARILCWRVLPEYCNRGIGSSLLGYLEQSALNHGIRTLSLTFRSDWPSRRVVEKTLHKRGWSSPREILRLYKATRSSYHEPAWFSRVKLREGYRLFPWRELSSAEREGILERQRKEAWYPNELTPFQEKASIEWSNSLGLRFHDEVVGWMITHRVAPDVIQYTSLFVSPEHRLLAGGMPLIIEAVRRHEATDVNRAIFQVQSQNQALIKFVDRRLKHLLATDAERLQSTKELNSND